MLVGALNMDEYAYGFSTENTHYGPTRNPHNPGARRRRLLRRFGGRGGGGAGAAHAGLGHQRLDPRAGLVLRRLGPEADLRAPDQGGFVPFANSLDHLGPFAASVDLLAAAYDVMQGRAGCRREGGSKD